MPGWCPKLVSTHVLAQTSLWSLSKFSPKNWAGLLNSRAGQIFFGQKLQTSQLSLGQNMSGHQFWAPSRQILPRPWSWKIGNSSPTSLKMGQFWSSWGAVRYTQMEPKNGVHLCLGPKSPVEFLAFDQKIFGQP